MASTTSQSDPSPKREAGRPGTLAFVHVSHPDEIKNRQVQTHIRRHVMRDIGNSRRTRKNQRSAAAPVHIRARHARPQDDEGSAGTTSRAPTPSSTGTRESSETGDSPAWALNRKDSFGVVLDLRALELVHFSTLRKAGPPMI